MAIKRLLLSFTFIFVSIVFSSGVSFALATTDGASGSTFVWSQVSPTVGAKLKVLEVVSSPLKGTPTYRASGVCSLRKGVLSFNRAGKCRVSLSVKLKSNGKVLRSSKVITVEAKATVASPTVARMPDPIGCAKAASHPRVGTKYPASEPGYFEFQTGWICDSDALDARPLLEYFKSQGWTQKSTTAGDMAADLYKGSNRVSYSTSLGGVPEGKAFLMLTIY